MDKNIKIPPTPKIEQLREYLTEYGWTFREGKNDETTYLYAPLMLPSEKAVLITFNITGVFVMVSTLNLLKDIPIENAKDLLGLNDIIKLVKIFSVPEEDTKETINAEIGFELCCEAWEKYTFFSFMDMLSLGIEKTLEKLDKEGIKYTTQYLELEN